MHRVIRWSGVFSRIAERNSTSKMLAKCSGWQSFGGQSPMAPWIRHCFHWDLLWSKIGRDIFRYIKLPSQLKMQHSFCCMFIICEFWMSTLSCVCVCVCVLQAYVSAHKVVIYRRVIQLIYCVEGWLQCQSAFIPVIIRENSKTVCTNIRNVRNAGAQ